MGPICRTLSTVALALVAPAVVAASTSAAVSTQTEFTSIACMSTRSCTAVGYFLASGGEHTLAERFDGRHWSIKPTPSPGTAPELSGLSCPSRRFCVAVGTGSRGTVAELWDGSRWRLTASRNPWGSDSALSAVSCPQAGLCMAVGAGNGRSGDLMLVERFSRGAWTAKALAAPPGTSFIDLDAISCASETSCLAVGFGTIHGRNVAVAERYDKGTWANVPLDARGRQPELTAVSCPSVAYCLSVGAANLQGLQGPIAFTFSGASPNELSPRGGNRVRLAGLDCVAVARCVTVGTTSRGSVDDAYSETLDGTRWSATRVSNPGVPDALGSVWCQSLRSCVAAGYYAGQGAEAAPLSELLSGRRWRSVPGVAKQR